MPNTAPIATRTLEDLVLVAGGTLAVKHTLRFPARFREEFEHYVRANRLTGRLTLDYSQGGLGYMVWESHR